ncbi:MAG: type II toxin-antitoxin system RelE/ParE family toxin [Hyphomicrobium aestuarii]|nr:type II toxin-antitoxin system RelE/ParE family toxin [Hyphomicrobium aestuarii]
MKVVRDSDADAELNEVSEYLADRSLEQADGFLSDFEETILRIIQFSHAHPPLRKGFRRILLARFAYQFVYRVEGDTIRIYAVAHLKRRPGSWRKRLR